ncbi:argininosuccinate synthase, partial [Candidatus Gottesmanbacteria bacterium]|nr:argininosuccinate synthase [Candidatus Gottesmanbacteria bacterium]
SRDEEILYAQKNNIPTPARRDFPYSSDDNMWGVTWEGGEIEDPQYIPKIERFQVASRLIEKTPNTPDVIRLTFQKGIPVSINGNQMKLSEIIMKLNEVAGRHGVGVVHHLEDRLVGLKNRGVYELPGAHVIIQAHRNLEKYVATRLENELKETLDIKWGHLCYGALWHDPVMADINAFNDKINEKVTGEVTVRLFKGQAIVVALTSPFGLHHASFNRGEGAAYNIQDSAPFIEVYSMQARHSAQRAEKTALISAGKLEHKKKLLPSVKKLHELGFQLFATDKTHAFLMEHEIPNLLVHKISNGGGKPNLKNVLIERGFDLIINTPTGGHDTKEDTDGTIIRRRAVETKTPIATHVDIADHIIDKLYRTRFGKL